MPYLNFLVGDEVMQNDDQPVLVQNQGRWYLELRSVPVHRTITVRSNLRLHMDESGRVVGIEGTGPITVDPVVERFCTWSYVGPLTPMPMGDKQFVHLDLDQYEG